jgi:hypothetical protein
VRTTTVRAVIGSLNGTSAEGWLEYARLIRTPAPTG